MENHVIAAVMSYFLWNFIRCYIIYQIVESSQNQMFTVQYSKYAVYSTVSNRKSHPIKLFTELCLDFGTWCGACHWKYSLLHIRPYRKKYSLIRDKYFCEDSRIHYLHWKSWNMHSEWGNIKECNKHPLAILNICGCSGQLMTNP